MVDKENKVKNHLNVVQNFNVDEVYVYFNYGMLVAPNHNLDRGFNIEILDI